MCMHADKTLRLYVRTFGLPEKEVIEYVELIEIVEADETDESTEKFAELHVNETQRIDGDCTTDATHEQNLIENQSIELVAVLSDKPSEVDEITNKKSDLNRHRKKFHQSEKPFDCTECGQTFAQAQTLARHTKIHQSDQRNKICSFCGKCFIRSDDLKRHIRIHTGESIQFQFEFEFEIKKEFEF